MDIEKERELERQARIEASLREREREVQKARSEQTKEIDREREQHKREEAIQHFKALMSDMVRRPLSSINKRLNMTFKVCQSHIKKKCIHISGTVIGCNLVGHTSQPEEGPSLGVGIAVGERREGEAV